MAAAARWGTSNGLIAGSAPGSGATGYGHGARLGNAVSFAATSSLGTAVRTTINSRPETGLPATQAGAKPRLPVGMPVEYLSHTRGQWTPAHVKGFDESAGTYVLDIQPSARPELVRPRGHIATPHSGNESANVGMRSGHVLQTGGYPQKSAQPPSGSRHIDTMHPPPAYTGMSFANESSASTSSQEAGYTLQHRPVSSCAVTAASSPPQALPNGLLAEYCNSKDCWVPAVIENFSEDTCTYKLDIEPFARFDRVRRLQDGTAVEYYRASKNTWVPAEVTGFNDQFGTYALDIQPFAQADKLRLAHGIDVGDTEVGTGTSMHTGESADAHPSSKPVSENAVQIVRATTADDKSAILVNDARGNRIGAFPEADTIEFELHCDADSLKTWLNGLSPQLLAGLLALLTGEVQKRGEALKTAEKERDALRGEADYEFFGLDGETCTDRDIDRAYRKASVELHPDKGGDELEFNAMRQKYDQLKKLRGDGKMAKGGAAITWEPDDQASMLRAHGDLREQLVWISRMTVDVEHQLQDLRKGRVRQSLTG